MTIKKKKDYIIHVLHTISLSDVLKKIHIIFYKEKIHKKKAIIIVWLLVIYIVLDEKMILY